MLYFVFTLLLSGELDIGLVNIVSLSISFLDNRKSLLKVNKMFAVTEDTILKVDDLSQLLVVYGVIAGLILVRIATFTANRFSRSELGKVPMCHWLWLGIFFFLVIQSWWGLFPWFSLPGFSINFFGYSILIITPLLVYLATVLITPHHDEEWKMQHEDYFHSKLTPLYLLCISALLLESAVAAYVYQEPGIRVTITDAAFSQTNLVRYGCAVILGIFVMIPKGKKFHEYLPCVLLAALILFVLLFQNISLVKIEPPCLDNIR
ncbi:MAG: hypothetical protein AAGH72_11630 [Verrucomicrobiota bacterium]